MNTRWCRLARGVAFVIILVASLAPIGAARAQNTTEADIARAEAAWRGAVLSEYVITVVVNCFCSGAGRPMAFPVKDGSAEPLGTMDEGELKLYSFYNTVEKLFADLRQAVARRPFRLAVTFHPQLGYPTSADIDPVQNAIDDELRFHVLDVRSGSTPPDRVALTGQVVVPRPMVSATSGIPARSGGTPFRDVRVSELVADVAAVNDSGRCENFPVGGLPTPAVKMLIYAMGPAVRPTRRVSVMLAADGRVVRYSDLRGDLRAIMDPSVTEANPLGRVTSIAIDFDKRSAVVRNEHGGAPTVGLRAVGPDVLTAVSLGNPAEVVNTVRAACEK